MRPDGARIAIIDLGTNTFNLLVAEREGESLRVVHDNEAPVFLGQGGIERGTITPDAFERGMVVLRDHMATAKGLGVSIVRGYGTSALRNARNGADLVRRAKRELDLDIEVIAGEEEAGLILDGVRLAVRSGRKPMLVMDIGGGSIEFMLATDRALLWKRSFELGVTRLRERIPVSDPLPIDQELRIAGHLDQRLMPLWAAIDQHRPRELVGSAGSFDSLARMIAEARGGTIDADRRSMPITALEFIQLKDRLIRMDRSGRLRVPGLPEHRVDVIAYALIAIELVLARGPGTIHWSRYALKEGAAWRMLHGPVTAGDP